jgi:hypothetical protein
MGLNEAFSDNGEDRWFVGGGTQPNIDSLYNGFRFGIQFDHSQVCPAGSTAVAGTTSNIGGVIYNDVTLADGVQGHWMHFYAHYLSNGTLTPVEQRKLKMGLYWVAARKSNWPPDFGGYQLAALIDALNTTGNPKLQDVPFTVANLGSGNYRLSWTVPAGSQSYRIKWSPLAIAPSSGLLNFDPVANTFGLNPDQYDTWFGANNVNEPAPAAAGTTQTLDVAGTGAQSLTAQNFSIKAYVVGGVAPVGPAANLSMVSGDGQSGTPGQRLPNPVVVKVTDAIGNPVSGTTVSFAVTAGGGTLSAPSGISNVSGLASATLTLGPTAGTNTVRASSGSLAGSPVTFNATATVAAPTATTLTLFSGNGQTGTVGQPLSGPFIVKVTDAGGNPVSGRVVNFAVTAGGGTLTVTSGATDSQGLASTVLTLGPLTGSNTVMASSGALTGSPVMFQATGSASGSGSGITWILQPSTGGRPSFVGWTVPQFDPVSQQTLFYAGPPEGPHGIYSTDLWAYSSALNVFTRLVGTGSTGAACPADMPNVPGDRHPGWQMAVDTKRSFLWLYGGVNQACNGAGINISGTAVTWVNGTSFHSTGRTNRS